MASNRKVVQLRPCWRMSLDPAKKQATQCDTPPRWWARHELSEGVSIVLMSCDRHRDYDHSWLSKISA